MDSNMDDMYMKPGNQERGWNDPPQFSYGLQMARGPQRNLLNKRAAPPASAPPPPGCMATPPPPSGPIRSQKEAESSQPESEPDVQAVVLVLKRALAACRRTVRACHWDTADEIHRSLMVDHVTEVSQWMVGVKRLISETRNLSPELLEPLHYPAEPVQDPTEPDQDPTEPDQDPTEPDQDPAEPVQDPTEPDQDPAEPVQDPVSPS
ncbi:hypothetical protein F2P81_024874 [Scophthalmus maximus]|uniref:SRA1/Sec31 domain-containing protein n=1 Tax=Scophthalmus maximus TaxID=52904 RepID=A0A6A4RM15_SCOMX|nr:hypothetical protein F2P81_024874 [Scophthalmus maximus]